MKSLTTNLMLAAAALLAASGAASAADMRVEIPFAFQAANQTMSPGTYKVISSNGESRFLIKNVQSGEGIFLLPLGDQNPKKAWTSQTGGVMEFACNDAGCVLTQLWTGKSYPAHGFSSSKAHEDKTSRVALVHIAVSNAK